MPFSTKQLVFGFSTALLALTTGACGGNAELVVQPQTIDADAGSDASEPAAPLGRRVPLAPAKPVSPLIVAPSTTQPGGDTPPPDPSESPVIR